MLSRMTRRRALTILCFFSVVLAPPESTLFPYTTLFRSILAEGIILVWGPVGISHLPPEILRGGRWLMRSEEHTSELQSLRHLVCRLLREKKREINAPNVGHHDERTAPRPRSPGEIRRRA